MSPCAWNPILWTAVYTTCSKVDLKGSPSVEQPDFWGGQMVTPSPESDAFLWLDSYVVVEGSYQNNPESFHHRPCPSGHPLATALWISIWLLAMPPGSLSMNVMCICSNYSMIPKPLFCLCLWPVFLPLSGGASQKRGTAQWQPWQAPRHWPGALCRWGWQVGVC